jgi:hypothetical protein
MYHLSFEFKQFAEDCGFEVIHSDTNYQQSNCLSRKGVGMSKGMLRKATVCGEDV